MSARPPLDGAAIWAAVKDNHARRRACAQHRFEGFAERKFGQKHTCLACGTTMQASEILLYAAGFKAAGGDPQTIWPGADL